MKAKVSSIILILVLAMALNACTSNANVQGAPSADSNTTSSDSTAEDEGEAQAPSISLEQTKFELGHLNSTAHLLGFVAAEEGFFAEEGLDVTLTQFASAGELVTGLEAEKLDAAFIGSVPSITFQSQGHDITIFGGAMSNGHGYVIKPEFTEGLDEWDITILRGRNIASVQNSIQDLELQILLTNEGIDLENDVNIVYFDSQRDAYTALQNAEIDAASVYSPYASLAQDSGYEVVYYCNEIEEFHEQPCCRQVALTGALAEKPNTFQAFERALIKAYKFSQENQEQTVEDVSKYIDIDKELIRYEVYGGHSVSHPDPHKVATITLKEEVVAFGYTTDYDIEPLYNTSIYQQALESLIAANPEDAFYQELLDSFEA